MSKTVFGAYAMSLSAEQLRQQVIIPTLEHLGVSAQIVIDQLVEQAKRGSKRPNSLGPFAIGSDEHRRIWDEHLAFRPELASKIRGLASQRYFLEDPDQELIFNLAYSTAIAWAAIHFAKDLAA